MTMLENGDFISDLERWKTQYATHFNKNIYSTNTYNKYSFVIDNFIEYSRLYDVEMTLKGINTPYLHNFLNYMQDLAYKNKNKLKNKNNLSKSTKQLYIKALKSFFNYISENNDDLYNFDRIFKNLKIPNSSKSEDKLIYLNASEINRLLSLLEKEKTKETYNAFRNALLVKVMLFGGLRISEALNIRLCDFTFNSDLDLYQITLPQAKGGKEQIAYINVEHIKDEVEYFKSKIDDNILIMRTKNNTPLNRTSSFIILNRLYKSAMINKRGCHILRHTLAIQLTEKGVNLAVIKKILRHSNIATTTIYAKATAKGISEALGAK